MVGCDKNLIFSKIARHVNPKENFQNYEKFFASELITPWINLIIVFLFYRKDHQKSTWLKQFLVNNNLEEISSSRSVVNF